MEFLKNLKQENTGRNSMSLISGGAIPSLALLTSMDKSKLETLLSLVFSVSMSLQLCIDEQSCGDQPLTYAINS